MKIQLVLVLAENLYPTDPIRTDGYKAAFYAPDEKLIWLTDLYPIELSQEDLQNQSKGFFSMYGHRPINLNNPLDVAEVEIADGFNNSPTIHILRTFEIEPEEYKIPKANNR